MKHKRKISLFLVAVLVLGILSGCGADGDVSSSTTKNETTATYLSAEEDARLKEELQQDIDAILNTETAIVHSDTYIPGETYTGTAYYVSNDGDDNNDGLTPETAWRTLKKVSEACGLWGDTPILKYGDAVFFRRGDIFRLVDIGIDPYLGDYSGFQAMVDGITYSAYGEGDKPIITESSENGSGAEKWSLVYEDDTGKKIWQYYRDMRDISIIVLNNGEALTTRVYEYYDENGYISCEAIGWNMYDDDGVVLKDTLLPLEESMTEDLFIISRPERFEPEVNYIACGVGPLYLRCDSGNPGELYESIEFTEYQLCGNVFLSANDNVFDNISFRCGGTAYFKLGNWDILGVEHYSDVANTLIQYCEFAYGGGCVTDYYTSDSGRITVGAQGDGIYCIVNNFTAKNNYFHDSHSGTFTFEYMMEDTTTVDGYYHILNNVLVNTDGIRLDGAGESLAHLDSVKVCGNQVWDTGHMNQGSLIYAQGAFYLWPFHYYDECIIEDNVFYGTENGHPMNALLNLYLYDFEGAGYTWPQFGNNIYVQYSGRKFGDFLIQNEGESWTIDDPELLTKAAEWLGDTTSKFYIIPEE